MKNLIVFLNALPRFSLNIKMPLFVKSSDDHLGGLYYLLTNEIQCLILFTLMYLLESWRICNPRTSALNT